jgi:hypothetical protein
VRLDDHSSPVHLHHHYWNMLTFLVRLVGVIIFHSSRIVSFNLYYFDRPHHENNTMTVLTLEQDEPDHVEVDYKYDTMTEEEQDQETISSLAHPMPSWVSELRSNWGETVVVNEWQQDDGTYRAKHGWQVRKLLWATCPIRGGYSCDLLLCCVAYVLLVLTIFFNFCYREEI